MTRPLALILSAAALLPTAAAAATYSASPIAPVAERRIIARDMVWACGPAACQGATDYSRPAILCQDLVKQAGRVASFSVDGRALAPDALDKCNAAARGRSAPALARN